MSDKTNAADSRKIFCRLVVATILYLALLLFWIAQTEVCSPAPNYLRSTWILQLFDDYLRCRPINELGDFLAGAAAPVAFLWLVGAVIIQSHELSAQREELRQAREQMGQQIAESKAATEFIGQQTEILKKEQQQREWASADAALQEALAAMSDAIKIKPLVFKVKFRRTFVDRNGDKQRSTKPLQWVLPFSNDLAGALAKLDEWADSLLMSLKGEGQSPSDLDSWNQAAFETWLERIRAVIHASEGVSPAIKIRLDAYQLAPLLEKLETLYSLCKEGVLRPDRR